MADPSPIGSADTPPDFTPQEEAFLRAYSDSLHRADAMAAAGLGANPANPDAYQAMLQHANGLIARAELLPMRVIASALGADTLYFLARLKAMCDAEPRIAIQGLRMLGAIHGLLDVSRARPRNRALRIEPPAPRDVTRRVHNLPFDVPVNDVRDVPRGTRERERG